MNAIVLSLILRFGRINFRFTAKVLGYCRAQLRGEKVPLRYRTLVRLTLRNVRGYAPTVGVKPEHIMELLHLMQALFNDLSQTPSGEWAERFVKYQDGVDALGELENICRPSGGFRGTWIKNQPEKPCNPHAGMSHGPCEQRKS